jgi:hypothetical protein
MQQYPSKTDFKAGFNLIKANIQQAENRYEVSDWQRAAISMQAVVSDSRALLSELKTMTKKPKTTAPKKTVKKKPLNGTPKTKIRKAVPKKKKAAA